MNPTIAMAGVLAALGGLATVWLLAAPAARQAEIRPNASTTATDRAGRAHSPTKVRLRWDPSTDTDVTGYVVSWGDAPSTYTQNRAVGPDVTTVDLDVVPRPEPYFIAIQARNTAGQVGGYSNELGLDLSSGAPRAVKVPKAKPSSSPKKAGAKPKLTEEERAQRRLEKQERKKKAREAAKQKQPIP